MTEEVNPHEIREQIEKLEEKLGGWKKYLALTTALIAVIAAIASMLSGNYADRALLMKNDAVLHQNKASDQWSYYQAKGVKKNLAEALAEQSGNARLKVEAERYGAEQKEIKTKAEEFEGQVREFTEQAEKLFDKHHELALGVTFFQIAIALSAISALMDRKSFWLLSVLLTAVGLVFACMGMVH